MGKQYIAGYWIGENGAEEKLHQLGYVITGDDRGNDSFYLKSEHAHMFNYEHGTPACAGRLTFKGAPLASVYEFLAAHGEILATHDGAEYCYVSEEQNLQKCAISRVSPEEALDRGWAEVRDGMFFIGSVELCPIAIDYQKTRRRVEDALRKTGDIAALIRIAAILNVKIA